jgi:hypothetical protein
VASKQTRAIKEVLINGFILHDLVSIVNQNTSVSNKKVNQQTTTVDGFTVTVGTKLIPYKRAVSKLCSIDFSEDAEPVHLENFFLYSDCVKVEGVEGRIMLFKNRFFSQKVMDDVPLPPLLRERTRRPASDIGRINRAICAISAGERLTLMGLTCPISRQDVKVKSNKSNK